MPQSLVLASSSKFRRQLLNKLNLDYQHQAPAIDETAYADEEVDELVKRLASNKAKALAEAYPNALIIGLDQAAVLDGKIIGKPHTHEQAVAQLKASSGKRLTFYTGLALYNSATNNLQYSLSKYSVCFKRLTDDLIESYLRAEQPYQCAGSFKAEGLGIILFEKLEGDDPNSLIGLPLIELISLLENEQFELFNT